MIKPQNLKNPSFSFQEFIHVDLLQILNKNKPILHVTKKKITPIFFLIYKITNTFFLVFLVNLTMPAS